ncbi:MAG: methyltransferase domain-containing protein [Chitinophagaceae bacterium]|nr:methyltransferase domain-containing protein [Chitinophagaceae bacterium]
MFNSFIKAVNFLRANGNTAALVYDDMLGETGLAFDKKTNIPSVNMGYWKHIDDTKSDKIHQANRAMFRLVSEAASFSENDEKVVDIGCGFATNMKYCLDNHKINNIVGLNISPIQTAWANRYLHQEGHSAKAIVILGSATSMPFADASVDKMISIEAAFHFETRELFLKEVMRVLKPGGILSLADLIICKPRSSMQKLLVKSIMKTLSVPGENVYDYDDYVLLMQKCGLEILEVEQLKNEVTIPFRKWCRKRPVALLFKYNFLWSIASIGFMFAKLDYIRVLARKK